MPGAWISTTDLQAQADKPSTPPLANIEISPTRTSSASPSVSTGVEPLRHDSFRTPLTPASANHSQRRGSIGVRKLLSLSGLRNSFVGSRTSIAISSPSSSPSLSNLSHPEVFEERPISRGTKRAASTLMPSPSPDGNQLQVPTSPLRKRKSTGWFRRTSQMFQFGENDASSNALGIVQPSSSSEFNRDRKASQASSRQLPYISRPISQLPQDPHVAKAARVSRNFTAPELYQAPHLARPHTSLPPQDSHALDAPQREEPPRTSHTSTAPQHYEPPKLPELDALGGGSSFNGGSLNAEDMFANIGR